MGTYIVGSVVAIAVFFAVRAVYKNMKSGDCAGGCNSCDGCPHANEHTAQK